MVMYKLNTKELVSLIGKKMDERSNYNPVEDINGDYFISEVEHKVCGLGVKTDYIPPEIELAYEI